MYGALQRTIAAMGDRARPPRRSPRVAGTVGTPPAEPPEPEPALAIAADPGAHSCVSANATAALAWSDVR